MKLYNTHSNPEFAEAVAQYCAIRTSWDYGYDSAWYEDLVENKNNIPIYFVYDENRNMIISILTRYTRFEQTVWRIGANEELVVPVLLNLYPDGFFASGNGYYLQKAGLHAINCASSYDDGVIYPVIVNSGIWASNAEMVSVIRDWLESRYLIPDNNWGDKIEYRWISVRDFEKEFYDKEIIDWPFQRNSNGHSAFIGFHYMNWEYTDDDTRYLVATVNNTPIGCICIQKFELYGYYALSYIDVAAPYKNNGVAKKMIHELTTYIPDDFPLLLSMESEEGQTCHIHECFKREKWPKGVFTQEEFDEMCRKRSGI